MILTVPVTEVKPDTLTYEGQDIVKAARLAIRTALALPRIDQICQEMM